MVGHKINDNLIQLATGGMYSAIPDIINTPSILDIAVHIYVHRRVNYIRHAKLLHRLGTGKANSPLEGFFIEKQDH